MMQTSQKRRAAPGLSPIVCGVLLLIAFLCFFSGRWFVRVYGRTGFDSILYTLSASLGGVQGGLIRQYLLQALLPSLASTALGVWLLFFPPWKRTGKFQAPGNPRRLVAVLLSVMLTAGLIGYAAIDVELVDYILNQANGSELYDANYVDPNQVKISFPEKKRNLIYIYLESMETTFLSQELGGAMDENLIPELYDLAKDNVCFSNSDADVGGFYTASGATWTVGAMVAQTAGIPLKTPTKDVNQYGASGEDFLPGVTSLTSILQKEGYYQALMVGSDANFGGRKPYFLQHGMDQVYDIYTARRDGIVPQDYFVWWGIEDLHLFEYAKKELTRIAAQEQPFAFSMLTVDTHHVGGYQCPLCRESASGETYDQSISCSSRQVAAFVEWIQAQPFYENTTVIIVGDHESMDNGYISRTVEDGYQRLVYNCFINAAATPVNTKNRQFCAVDLFPTTLAAMGCKIEGNRLGLGVNLFSPGVTLSEKMGFERFNQELAKASDFYTQNFFGPTQLSEP